ncbi:MAG: helix-turn-helix domain-containing protein [Planctomycetes bacterium]|nr:helix-turn-helix domain-containing protein [Planctomycetota bacterium]
MVKPEEFVTIIEAAQILGVSSNALRNWHRDGKMIVYRNPISGHRLFKRKDLAELSRQTKESGQHPTGWKRPKRRTGKPR